MISEKEITILLADDHPLFREGVKQVLNKTDHFKIIAEVENGVEALDKIEVLTPDIAILDIRMPGKSGLKVLAELCKKKCYTKIILLTMHKNLNYFYKAISLGVKGYVLKEVAVSEINDAINKVVNGETYISSSLAELLVKEKKSPEEVQKNIEGISSLTQMEREVLKLVAEWESNVEISQQLFISPRTVGNHRTNVANKLNLHGIHGLIQFAIENKELF
ncbi:MAG: response regulator transcription factor [Ignavibacteria bacterium]|jgi:DNA-binding NarL/FixJ family response regulator